MMFLGALTFKGNGEERKTSITGNEFTKLSYGYGVEHMVSIGAKHRWFIH